MPKMFWVTATWILGALLVLTFAASVNTKRELEIRTAQLRDAEQRATTTQAPAEPPQVVYRYITAPEPITQPIHDRAPSTMTTASETRCVNGQLLTKIDNAWTSGGPCP